MIIYLSPVKVTGGTGYGHIGTHICTMLNNYDKVVCLSFDYQREEHHFDFPIVPVQLRHAPMQIAGLVKTKQANVRLVIVAMDIPLTISFVKNMKFDNVPVWGIFPVEAGPLSDTWANGLWPLKERFVISEFGKKMMDDANVPSHYLPIPAHAVYSYVPDFDRTIIRDKLQISHDSFTILSIADNHERKNLSAAFEIFARFNAKVPNSNFVLVTRLDSEVGWNLDDLAFSHGIKNKVRVLDRKQPIEGLAALYRSSDVFLITSKAEGLCLPVREAMACGTPVMGTDCTSLSEQLQHGGIPIPPVFSYCDVFGNSTRSFINTEIAVEKLLWLHSADRHTIDNLLVQPGLEYARSFTWQNTLDVLMEPLKPKELSLI